MTYYVTPADDTKKNRRKGFKWKIKRGGNKQPTSYEFKKRAAVKRAKKLGKRNNENVVIYNSDGEHQRTWTAPHNR